MKVNCTMNILQVTPSMLYFKYEIERFSKGETPDYTLNFMVLNKTHL